MIFISISILVQYQTINESFAVRKKRKKTLQPFPFLCFEIKDGELSSCIHDDYSVPLKLGAWRPASNHMLSMHER